MVGRIAAFVAAVVRNRTGQATPPAWCTYLVTFRCNARCGMCDSWRMKPGPELTPADVERVFAKLGRLDVVRISGGEPFLRQDLREIAETIVRVSGPRVVHVTTNGSMPDRIVDFARRFSAPRRLAFMISFDGHRQEHDASRGKDVTYDKALDSVRRLAALRTPLGLDVSVNHTVISAQSLADSERLRAELAPLGVDVQSVLAYADSAMYGIKLRGKRAEHLIVPAGYPLHPKLAGADVIGFVERELARTASMTSPARRLGKRYYLRGLLARLRPSDGPQPHPRCVALRSHVRLLPDGSVPVCQFNTEVVGNLATQPMADVWHGAKARSSRAWVDTCPGCWAECEIMPSAIYTGDLVAEAARAALR